jgi:hypothetical protein
MNKTRLTAIAIAAVASLSLVSAASANTFCVHSPVACVGTPQPNLNSALQTANNNGAGIRDTIRIGPGNFLDGPSTIAVGNPVDIVGESMSTTIIRTDVNVVAAMQLLEPSSTISNLQIQIAAPGSVTGLLLAGQADDIRVTTTETQNGDFGVEFKGTTGILRHASISIGYSPSASAFGVYAGAGSEGVIEDSSVSSQRGLVSTGGIVDVRRSRIQGQQAVVASTGGYIHLSDSAVHSPGAQPSVLSAYGLSVDGPGGSVIVGDRLTVYGDGTPNSWAVYISPSDVPGNHAYLTLANSVLTGFDSDAYVWGGVNSASTFTTSYTAYRFGKVLTPNGGVHNKFGQTDLNLTGVDPGFGGEGPVPLRAGSPLIDAGDPGYQLPGQFDIYHQERIRDGDGVGGARVDIGAFEYQHVAPVVTASATPDVVAPGTPVTFTGTATDGDLNDELTYAWAFDDGTVASSADAEHAFSSPGSHTATLTVTDSSGLSRSVDAIVTVNAPPAPPAPVDDPLPPSGQPTPPAVVPTAPRLTGLRLSRTTFRARGARTQASRLVRVGTIAKFSTSEPVRVTLMIQRLRKGRWVSVGKLVAARGAGRTSVRFDGRIHRKPLKAGRYRMRVVARDADGMSSAARVARFRIA